jgi:hypothetical protein
MRRTEVMVAFAVLGASCGYLKSGTWENDPRNWVRAFDSDKPSYVEVVHSKYWRSPHFTYEFQYFFEVSDGSGQFKEELFSRNSLIKLSPSEAAEARDRCFGEPPAWFVPRQADEYDVWVYRVVPRGNFRVFVEKNTGSVFLTDHQV